jgi:hypothetical protein
MRHIFGFDHIPLGAVDLSQYFDTRLVNYLGNGATAGSTALAGGWVSGAGTSTFQSLVLPVYNDTPTHIVIGFRARLANAFSATLSTPMQMVNGSTFTSVGTQAELDASQVKTSAGDYFSYDINLVSGVMRRWIGKLELPSITYTPANLKAAIYLLSSQAYNSTYAAYQFRDIYIGDNFDGIDVNVLGDRVVNSLPVKSAVGANWAATDAGPLVTALNKAWVTGATDVTASNLVDNGGIRVQFNQLGATSDIDAVQVEAAGAVGTPTTGIKIARENDATGKTFTAAAAVKWGARSPIYQLKSDGSKITAVDFASMNFDISGV